MAHHPDGRVIFVPFAAPGDRVRVRIVEERRRYLRGRVETLLESGPSRVDPVCPVFGGCGGCAWQHVAYEAQLAAKARIVEDALRRVGGLAFDGRVAITPSPLEYGYRSRSRVVRHDGRVGFRKRASRSLQSVSRCPVLEPELDRELHRLVLETGRSGGASGEWELAGVGGRGAGRFRSTLRAAQREPWTRRSSSMPRGICSMISPGVFFQANGPLRPALADADRRPRAGSGCARRRAVRRRGLLHAVPVASVRARDRGGGDTRPRRGISRRIWLARGSRQRGGVVHPARRCGGSASAGGGRAAAGSAANRPASGQCRTAGSRPEPRLGSCISPAIRRRWHAISAGPRCRALSPGITSRPSICFPQTPHVETLAVLERRPEA